MGGSTTTSAAADIGQGFSTGKRWTLAITKEDETTPGPIYDLHQVEEANYKSKFKFGREDVRIPPEKNQRLAKYCREGPGHVYDLPDHWARESSLSGNLGSANGSILKSAPGFLLPKEKRLQADSKTDGSTRPAPNTYQNTNEIMRNHVQRMPGKYSIGSGQRRIEVEKFSSVHSELIEKGLF